MILKNPQTLYLKKILEELDNFSTFLKEDPELQTLIAQDAIKMSIIIIALSVDNHLSEEFKKNNPLNVEIGTKQKPLKLTWDDLKDNRKNITHQYYDVRPKILKNTTTITLQIKETIKAMLLSLEQLSTTIKEGIALPNSVHFDLIESSQSYSNAMLVSQSSPIISAYQTSSVGNTEPTESSNEEVFSNKNQPEEPSRTSKRKGTD